MATIYEWCPNCDYENEFENWDVKRDGYAATCKNCGKELMLCDMCMHTDDFGNACDCHLDCNWVDDGARCYRKGFNTRKEEKVMGNFYDVCASVRSNFYQGWNEANSLCSMEIRRKALSFSDKELNFYKDRIKDRLDKAEFSIDADTIPSWYRNLSLVDAVYAETFGWGPVAEWFTEEYSDSEAFIISGENCFIVRGGHQKLMKQRIRGAIVQEIIRLFSLEESNEVDINEDLKISMTCNNSIVLTRPTPSTVTKQDITVEIWNRMTGACAGAVFDDATIAEYQMRKTNSFSIALKDGRAFKVIVKDLREED